MIKRNKPAIAVPISLLVLVMMLAALMTGCQPAAVGGTALASPPGTSGLGSASPTATVLVTMPPAATDSPSVEPQTSRPSAKPSNTPTATLPPTAKPAKTTVPAAPQWESKYKPVLDQYRQFAADISKYTGDGNLPDWKDPWGQIAADVMLSTRKFGYALRDMDSNGTPELFLLTSDGSIWAMYTLADGTPILLDTFWSRNTCVLDQTDAIYTIWSDGVMDSGQDAYRMAKDGRGLELIERFAVESTDENGNPLDEPRYYQCVGSVTNKKIISKAEADKEASKFPKDNAKSGLKFISLGE